MDKQIVIYPQHNEILLTDKKKQTTYTCNSVSLKIFTLNERNQTQKSIYYIDSISIKL